MTWARTWASMMWLLRISPTRNIKWGTPSRWQIIAFLENNKVWARFLGRDNLAVWWKLINIYSISLIAIDKMVAPLTYIFLSTRKLLTEHYAYHKLHIIVLFIHIENKKKKKYFVIILVAAFTELNSIKLTAWMKTPIILFLNNKQKKSKW